MRMARMVYLKEKEVIFYQEDSESLIQFFGPPNTFVVPCTCIIARFEGREIEAKVNTKENPIEQVRFTHIGGPITVIWAD